MRSETIPHYTDDRRTDQDAHVRDCYHHGYPRGCRRSVEEPRRHRPKWTIRRAVPDWNQRQKEQRQNWFPEKSATKKSDARDQQRNGHVQRALVSLIRMGTV